MRGGGEGEAGDVSPESGRGAVCRTGAERGDLIGREVEAVVVAVARKRQPVPKGRY